MVLSISLQKEEAMNLIIRAATFPLDDLKLNGDEHCLLEVCPSLQLVMNLFKHTLEILKKNQELDIEAIIQPIIERLSGQRDGDRRVSDASSEHTQ